jgi:hypothetical protein
METRTVEMLVLVLVLLLLLLLLVLVLGTIRSQIIHSTDKRSSSSSSSESGMQTLPSPTTLPSILLLMLLVEQVAGQCPPEQWKEITAATLWLLPLRVVPHPSMMLQCTAQKSTVTTKTHVSARHQQHLRQATTALGFTPKEQSKAPPCQFQHDVLTRHM